jgi:ribosomal protein L11 methyltransferase
LDFIELSFSLSPRDPFADILTAELAELGFDTFFETTNGIAAYMNAEMYSDPLLETVQILKDPLLSYSVEKKQIPARNWNEVWENNFEPVEISDLLLIRAPFHQSSNKFRYEIVIEPKMSFGTGHHETTFLMAQQLMALNVKDKQVLDMGCGTGILAILASKMQAKAVMAIDIEEWAFLNTLENAQRNETFNIVVEKGGVNLLAGHTFQLILANINKNVLLQQIGVYAACLEAGGELLLSGFFESDKAELENAARAQGLIHQSASTRNNWAMLHFTKTGL